MPDPEKRTIYYDESGLVCLERRPDKFAYSCLYLFDEQGKPDRPVHENNPPGYMNKYLDKALDQLRDACEDTRG